MRNRLVRIGELLDMPLDSADNRAALLIALRARPCSAGRRSRGSDAAGAGPHRQNLRDGADGARHVMNDAVRQPDTTRADRHRRVKPIHSPVGRLGEEVRGSGPDWERGIARVDPYRHAVGDVE